MSAVSDVFTYLDVQSLLGGTTAYRHRMMDTPDHQLVITADGGDQPQIPANDGIGDVARQRDGIQILCRSDPNNGDQALSLLETIYDALHGLNATTLGDTTYIGVRARTAAPVPLGSDDKGRSMFSHSYLLHRLV